LTPLPAAAGRVPLPAARDRAPHPVSPATLIPGPDRL